MQETFIINEKFTFWEYLSFTYILIFKLKLVRRLFIFLAVVGFFNAFLNATLSTKKEMVWYHILGQFLLPAVILFLFLTVGSIILTFLLRKLKPKLFSGTTLTFTHWGMEKKGEVINYSAPWSKFLKYEETSKFLFLFISDKESHVVQKRMFETETQLIMFKKFITEKIYSS